MVKRKTVVEGAVFFHHFWTRKKLVPVSITSSSALLKLSCLQMCQPLFYRLIKNRTADTVTEAASFSPPPSSTTTSLHHLGPRSLFSLPVALLLWPPMLQCTSHRLHYFIKAYQNSLLIRTLMFFPYVTHATSPWIVPSGSLLKLSPAQLLFILCL